MALANDEPRGKESAIEKKGLTPGGDRVELRLFVAGMGPRSTQAVTDLKRMCDSLLGARCAVEVVDIYEQPAAARDAQIVAVPTLVREHPLPKRKVIGRLADLTNVMERLDLRPLRAEPAT